MSFCDRELGLPGRKANKYVLISTVREKDYCRCGGWMDIRNQLSACASMMRRVRKLDAGSGS